MTFPTPPSLKGLALFIAILLWLYLLLLTRASIVLAEDVTIHQPTIPLFRHVPLLSVEQPLPAVPGGVLRLLADADFPPFSFVTADGKPSGLSVDLALTACAEMKVTCAIDAKPFDELLPALLAKRGDVIIGGLKLDGPLLKQAAMTRPYFWSFGRFSARRAQMPAGTDAPSLSGKTIGVVKGSTHAAWIKRYFPGNSIREFDGEAAAFRALKSEKADLVFADDLRLSFWLEGSDAANCCATVGLPFMNREGFTHNLVFLTRAEEQDLADVLDAALDRLQQSGATSALLQRYIPISFW